MDFSRLRVRAAWLLLGLPLAASAGLSFDDTTRLAREQAPSLLAQRSALAGAQALKPAAGTLPDPRLIVGVDNLPGSVPLETAALPRDCCVVFGSEGPGLTDEVVAACESVVAITQYGSTRSMNAGAAAAIAMHAWVRAHVFGQSV